MENKQPEPSQHMPTITIQQIELNRIELYNTLSAPSYKLWMALLGYMMSFTVKGKHGKSTILRTNKLTIDPQFLFDHCVVIKGNYGLVKEANRNARKLTKELVNAKVLTPLEKKDDFMINPLYFYKGDKYGDCYKEWCKLSTDTYQPQYNATYHQKHASLNSWTEIEDPELTQARRDKFDEEAKEHFNKQEIVEQLEEQVQQTPEEIKAYYKAHPSVNVIDNSNLITQYGKDFAYECMSQTSYYRACAYLDELPF